MDQQSRHKTVKEKLQPTADQERERERVLLRCRRLATVAREQRSTAWQRGHVAVSRSQQEAELKESRAQAPDYAALPSHVHQDVWARLDKTAQAGFHRVQRGARAGGRASRAAKAAIASRDRGHSLSYQECGNGARLDTGFVVLATIGRLAVRWSRPLAGAPKPVTVSREADGW